MQIAFMLHGFPNPTQTFIQNQVVGLLKRNEQVQIYAESNPEPNTTHGVVKEYDLEEKVIYSGDPQSFLDGARLLIRVVPSLLFGTRVDPRVVLSEFATGTAAPRRLSNLDAIAREKPSDIYHAHFGTVANRFLSTTRIRDRPFVASFYGLDASEALRSDPHRYDELFKHADAITVLSEDMRSTIVNAGCPESKTHIQPLSIDTELFPFQERTHGEGPIRLLTVARFVEKKGIVYAIEAVAALDEEYDMEYTIIGDGERRDLIETKIAEHDLEDTVELLGWQPQSVVADEMADAHLFLLPSVTAESGDKEGTPTVLLEAQSMGLPVVSTYHAGIPEIVADGESGLLVPERDSEALAATLETLLTEPDRWSEMGRRGRHHIEQRHSIGAVSGDLIELYRSLMS